MSQKNKQLVTQVCRFTHPGDKTFIFFIFSSFSLLFVLAASVGVTNNFLSTANFFAVDYKKTRACRGSSVGV